jgi:surfeit locus 1 family protein
VKLHPVAIGAVALLVAAVCTTAGFWQLSRLKTKRALNARRRAALAAPAEPLGASPGAIRRQAGRKVVAEGVYDDSRQVLLSARFFEGDLGVEVVTPLFTAASGTLLVDRGWMWAEDGRTARPDTLPRPGRVRVTGILEPVPARAGEPAWQRLETDGPELWSTHELDSASVARDLPYEVAPCVLVALPDSSAPAVPVRSGPPMLDETMHLSYAIQWFSFAAVTIVGSLYLAFRRRAPAGGTAVHRRRAAVRRMPRAGSPRRP